MLRGRGRRGVLWGAADGEGAIEHDLCKAEVDDDEVAIGIDHEVLGLEVAVGDVTRVEEL